MAVDYDLIILGKTAVARSAALRASRLKARVALVEPENVPDLEFSETVGHTLAQLAHRHVQAEQMNWLTDGNGSYGEFPALDWERSLQWAFKVAEARAEACSPARLSLAGVDVIAGLAEFVRRPHLGIVAEGRLLRSRRYLIATGSQSIIPAIAGLERAHPLTLEQLWPANPSLRAGTRLVAGMHLVLIGGSAIAIELAQTFNRLGLRVTLVVAGAELVPDTDPEVSRLLQIQLETEGVDIYLNTRVSQVRVIDHQKWVQLNTHAIPADDLLLVTGYAPALSGLNLAAVNITAHERGIAVNRKLQTAHPSIYACGGAIGYATQSAIAQVTTYLAVKNALFFPMFALRQQPLPHLMLTDPELGWLGLTEAQARAQYGDRLTILRHSVKTAPRSHMQGQTTGLCKLILHSRGYILGAHLLAPGAGEILGLMTLAVERRLPLQSLLHSTALPLTQAEWLHHAIEDWNREWGDRHPRWLAWLEGWFDGRRDRTR